MTLTAKISTAFKRALHPVQFRKDREWYLGGMCNSAWPSVKEVIAKYPDAVNWRDEQGMTALHWAATYRSAPMIEYLLDHGADIEAADKQGFRALHHAAQCAGDDPTAPLLALLARGAQIDPRNNNGTTPLLHAVVRNKPWNVKELIIAGANENAANNTGNTPLIDAKNSRSGAPAIYAAIEDGRRERERRTEEARLQAEHEERQTAIREAVESIGNGVSGDMKLMKPFRLTK